MIVTTLWAGLVAVAFCLAAYVEWTAIRDRISGANGFIFLTFGVAALVSVPIGFALLWLETDFHTAWLRTLAIAVGGYVLWRGLLEWLDRAGKRGR
jgi:hypothetical protein